MVDSSEELDPLFSYARVQPCIVSLDDDDSDASPAAMVKRRKGGDSNDVSEDVGTGTSNVDNDDDWLPSPPTNSVDSENQPGESSIMKELRLKKEELASLRKSAGDVIRAIEESARMDADNTQQDLPATAPPKHAIERPKIILSIQDKNGIQQFRVFKEDKLQQMFIRYAEKIKCDFQNLVFSFDGDKISPAETPDGLGMEDDDIIEVHTKKS